MRLPYSNEHFPQAFLAKIRHFREHIHFQQFPFSDAVELYHYYGKHFVPETVLYELNKTRQLLKSEPQNGPLVDFINILLDKYDDKYDYRSYIALALLNYPLPNFRLPDHQFSQTQIDVSLCALILDVLEFEFKSLSAPSFLPELSTNTALAEKRLQLGLKMLTPYLHRLGIEQPETISSTLLLSNYLQQLNKYRTNAEILNLETTMLPVYKVHDEYMFIRVLQSFECVFSWVSVELTTALNNFFNDIDALLAHFKSVTQFLDEATLLFPLLMTMRKEAFKAFRVYTEGASAIQSRNYKYVESICRKPDPDRLNSLAYDSVPEIKKHIQQGKLTIDGAFMQLKNKLDEKQRDKITDVMNEFELRLIRWRQSHYAIAIKMLGDEKGTGYSKGTPYLKDVRKIPVFHSTSTKKESR